MNPVELAAVQVSTPTSTRVAACGPATKAVATMVAAPSAVPSAVTIALDMFPSRR